MRRTFAVVVLAALALGAIACDDDNNTTPTNPTPNPLTEPLRFTATLSPANEVPPISNSEQVASGTATITMRVPRNETTGAVTGGGTIDFAVQINGFPAGSAYTAAHIHPGRAGVNGPAQISLNLTTTPINTNATINVNGITVSQTDATNISLDWVGYYFNVHTQMNPGGVIRGQLVKQ
jgi:hypothetical protein